MIARKSSLIMAINITEGILAYVAMFFIARYMGPNDYGIVGFATGFVGLFGILTSLGFNEAHIKRISEGKDLGRCIGTFLVTKVGLVSIMAIVTLSAILFWKVIIGKGFETSEHEIAIYIILVYFILERLATIFQITFSAETKIAKSQIPFLIATVTRTGAIIFVAVTSKTFGFGAIELAYAYVFGHIFLFTSSLIFFRKYPIKCPSMKCFKDYAHFAFPLIIVSSSSMIITNLDKVLIQLFWSATQVGNYFASYRIAGFIVMAGSSIGMILFPMISNLNKVNDMKGIREILFQSERYISLFTIPIVFGTAALAEPIVHILLSDSFSGAIPIFRILPFFALLYSLSIPYSSQLLGMGKPHLVRNRILIMVVLNAILNIILIPKDIQSLGIKLFGLGALGASIATVISYLFGFLYFRYTAWKLIDLKFNFKILLHFLAAATMSTILYQISIMIFINRWYQLLGVSLFGFGIYLVILVIVKEFSKQDFLFVIDTLNIRKMWNYITKEIKKE